MPSASDSLLRDALTSRVLPEMTLSNASNPLTVPLVPQSPLLSPLQRAQSRFSVKGNAIVTGGLGALGFTACRALLEHGLRGLYIIGSVEEWHKIDILRAEFPSVPIRFALADVTNASEIEQVVDAAAASLGSIDILLCFAGIVGCAHSVDVTPDEWRRILDVNTTGSWLCAQAAAKHMIKQQIGGSIVFTASISAHRVNFPQPQAAYNSSKAALLALTRSLAAEWAHYGIRVNSISPGYMDTILNEGEGLEAARKVWAERNPTGRMGDPEELTGPVVLLCSGAGKYINGADILVDGGSSVF